MRMKSSSYLAAESSVQTSEDTYSRIPLTDVGERVALVEVDSHVLTVWWMLMAERGWPRLRAEDICNLSDVGRDSSK